MLFSQFQYFRPGRAGPSVSRVCSRTCSQQPAIEPFTLGKLIIGQAVLILDDLGTGLPPVPVRLGEVTPLVFDDLYLGPVCFNSS